MIATTQTYQHLGDFLGATEGMRRVVSLPENGRHVLMAVDDAGRVSECSVSMPLIDCLGCTEREINAAIGKVCSPSFHPGTARRSMHTGEALWTVDEFAEDNLLVRVDAATDWDYEDREIVFVVSRDGLTKSWCNAPTLQIAKGLLLVRYEPFEEHPERD
jgi:hypothetical protein